ncbi:MAG TPA: alanyl-tRNA editing protein [Fimbriiglobus sp.]|nr:alanyl-tRNA editing protein [Fimbriiglobus sp.]
MTVKRYLASADLAGTATITHIGDDGRPLVQLSETLFHPQGGGQKADRGTVGGRAVTHVAHADGGEVNHYLDSTDGLSIGDAVELVVDAEWRQLNARWHTAGHLIAAVVEKLFPKLQGVAGHHWPDEGRVEFVPGDGTSTEEVAAKLLDALAEAVRAGLPVRVIGDPFSSREVVVGDSRPVGCGGTHLSSVGGLVVSVTGVKSKGGKLRVSYTV